MDIKKIFLDFASPIGAVVGFSLGIITASNEEERCEQYKDFRMDEIANYLQEHEIYTVAGRDVCHYELNDEGAVIYVPD